MEIVSWVSPMHMLKAAAYKTIVGDLAEVSVVKGFKDVNGKTFEDALFATPSFNPIETNVEFNIIRRYELGDWTVSTFLVTAYGYLPPKMNTPVPTFYKHPAKATINTVLTAFDKSFLEKADDELYDILSVMNDEIESLLRVVTALEELGDPKEAIEAISEDGITSFEMCDPEVAFDVLEEYGLKHFNEENVAEYSEEVTKNLEPELMGSELVNLITDEVDSNFNAEDEVTTCSSTTKVRRPELTYEHIDWNSFYWVDQLLGVSEKR